MKQKEFYKHGWYDNFTWTFDALRATKSLLANEADIVYSNIFFLIDDQAIE
jgi:hypothetical protein